MNLILESSRVPFYADMHATLTAIGVETSAYDWFVNDVETNVALPALSEGDVWVTGDELSNAHPRCLIHLGCFQRVSAGN